MSTSHPHARPDMRWSPRSRAGRLALGLGAGAVAGIVLLAVAFALDVVETADSLTDDWLLLVWGAAVLGCGAASAVAGAVAVTRRHDRSWSVVAVSLLGLLVALVMLREVVQGLW